MPAGTDVPQGNVKRTGPARSKRVGCAVCILFALALPFCPWYQGPDADRLANIRIGMTSEDVRSLLGRKPSDVWYHPDQRYVEPIMYTKPVTSIVGDLQRPDTRLIQYTEEYDYTVFWTTRWSLYMHYDQQGRLLFAQEYESPL